MYRCAQTVQIRPAHADKLDLLDQMKQTIPFPGTDREQDHGQTAQAALLFVLEQGHSAHLAVVPPVRQTGRDCIYGTDIPWKKHLGSGGEVV